MREKNIAIQINDIDLRMADSCFRIMHSMGFQLFLSETDINENIKLINQAIAAQQNSIEEQNEQVKYILTKAKESLYPVEQLEWIKDNERCCYFFWSRIVSYTFFSSPAHPTTVSLNNPQPTLAKNFSELRLTIGASSTEARYSDIVKFLDRVNQPFDWKHLLVDALKDEWAWLTNSTKSITWIKQDNEAQCLWAWNYIVNTDRNTKPTTSHLKPINNKEKFLAIHAALDAWLIHPDSKKLFLNDFNQAWQQKKIRDKREGKKACSLVLRNEVKQKLDELAKMQGLKLNQLVEELIEKEYASTIKKD
ncbi:RepB family protein [Pseudoalteromonas rhizosphaerae]|uniref:RepB family protein n=1 Tax=Pseudoalteromonas rhizosphaerae TaxID=2518973 RepID=UPI0037041D7F